MPSLSSPAPRTLRAASLRRLPRSLAALPIVVASFVAACGDASSPAPNAPPTNDAGTPSPVDAGPTAITWEKCPLHTEGGSPSAECTTVKLPLRATEPNGEAIDVFVKRYRPAGGKATRAMWMLQGGPGGSGYVFEEIAKQIGAKYPDVEFYMPDHRGTGSSTKITCAAQGLGTEGSLGITPNEWPACLAEVKAQWGDRLADFSTTNAANDVGLLIDRTRREGQTVFVYGVSYGAYWANRYLQLFPTQVDGVILDSIAGPGMSLARQDEDANEAARLLLGVCAKDATCATKLGADPWAKAEALVTKLKGDHCTALTPPAGFTRHEAVRLAFGSMLMSAGLRRYVPAAIYRLDRCSEADVAAMNTFFTAIYGTGEEGGEPNEFMKGWGFVLSNNVMFSELWETPPPTNAILDGIREGAVASREITAGLPDLFATWPRYDEPRAKAWATTDRPVLMLAGGLDPATLFRKQLPARDAFRGPNQHFVEVPSATHTVIASSQTSEKRSCGTLMMMAFLENPTAPLDTSCLANVVPISFDGDAAMTNGLFGTSNAWD